MKVQINDGGREAAGFKGYTGDCVTRSIAIATGLPYKQVYDALNGLAQSERIGKRKKRKSASRNGVFRRTYQKYLTGLGWVWVPTMLIGQGCKVHLADGELPPGRLIVRVTRHVTAVIDGVIHDTFDPQRKTYWYDDAGKVKKVTERCVYGYFVQKGAGGCRK